MQVFILSNLLFFFLISCTSIPPTSPPPTTQTTPPSVLTVDSFILDGFSILAHEKADFNMDGFEDAILILKNINEEEALNYIIKFLEKQSEWLNIDSLILDLKLTKVDCYQ